MSANITSQAARAVIAGLCCSAVFYPSLYQPLLESTWGFLRGTDLFHWSTFETLWTVSWYAWIEVWMTVAFVKYPDWRLQSPEPTRRGNKEAAQGRSGPGRTKPRGMRRPSRRLGEIAIYMLPLLVMDLTMIKKFADVPLSDILASGNYPLQQPNSSAQGLVWPPPRTFLVPTLHNFSTSSPLQLVRAVPMSAPSSRRIILELASSFVIYDFLFFLFHLSLHIVPVLLQWHAPHHAHDAQLNPQVTNQLSVLERLGLVMLANFSLNIIGSHVLTRTLFVPMFVWLLVEIHCGMDLPWGYEKILPKGWGGGARKHMMHHKSGDGSFEPFFCGWDVLREKLAIGKRKKGPSGYH